MKPTRARVNRILKRVVEADQILSTLDRDPHAVNLSLVNAEVRLRRWLEKL